MNTHTIGIDFGTTKTLVAWSNPDTGRAECLRLGRERDYMPTTIAVRNKGGELLFGDDAGDVQGDAEYTYISGFKMKLGSSLPLCMYLGKDNRFHSLTAIDLTREFLKNLRQKVEAECLMQGQVSKAVITYPIKFGPAQIDELQRAAAAAGFSQVELQYEPEAAGYAFCNLCPAEAFKNRALIVDWGGGTLDISLITREGGSFDTHREIFDGDMQMGGEIFDDRLWADVNERMKAKGVTFTPLDARRARPRVRQGKEHLSGAETCTLRLSCEKGVCPPLTLTRADFNKLIADSVSKAVDKVQNIIAKAAADQKPEMLLLVGGSSRIPLIKEKLEAACSLPACKWQYSREAVALGAALIAAYDRQDASAASDAILEQQTTPSVQTTSMSAGELNALGMRYWNGSGGSQNLVQAACSFLQAAQQGHAGAQYNLARCYQEGKGVPKDDQQAIHWFQLAAANGHKGAQSSLIQYNSKGEETLPSSKERSPEASKSNYQLGREIYCHPTQLQGYSKAAEYFQKGCDEGDVNAMYLLAVAYSTGLGVPRDYDQVLHLGDQLLERGCPLGHAILANALDSGYGCPLDAFKAEKHRRLLKQACASPVPGVEEELRYMALFLAEVEKDTPDPLHQEQYAREYFSLSKAPERHSLLVTALLSQDKEKHCREILQLLNDGVKDNDWMSMFFLGLLLMEPNNGICETDPERARTYLRNAARWGGAGCSLYYCVQLEQDEKEKERLQRMFWDTLLYGQSSIKRQDDLNLHLELVPDPFAAGYRVYETGIASSLLQQGRTDELISPSGPPTLRVTNERSESLSGLQLRICAPKQGLDKTFPVSQTIKAHETLELDLEDFGLTNEDSDLNIRISAPDGRYSEMEMSGMPSLATFVNDAIPPLLLYWEKGFFGGFVLKLQCLSEGEQIHNINVIKTSNQAHCGQSFDMNGDSVPVSVGWAEMSDSAGLQEGELFIVTCDEYSPIVAQIITSPGDQSSAGWKNIAKMGAAAAAVAASVLGS